MDDYWNSLGGISNIDAHQLAAINLQYSIKPDPALTQQQYNNQGFRYQPHGLVPTDQYGVPLGMNMYPSYGGSMSESLEERIRNSFADIDEERVLSLSSPEPELDQFLFPELAQASHNGTTSSPLNPPSQNSSPHLPSPTNTTTNTTAPPAVSVTGPIQTTPISQAFPTFHHQNQVGSVVQQSTSTSRSKSRETSSTTRHSVQANPSSSCEQSNSIEVILYHKPRGCKGVWQKVGQSDALRVTKGKGKWLKLEIKSHYEIKANDVDVFLVDATNSSNNIQLVHTPDEGITIESKGDSTNMGFYIVDVELKLDRVCKKLQMWCVAKNNYGFFKGKSVDFSAHNNGKANNKVKAEEIESQSEGSSSSSTSSSSREAAIATIKKRRRNDHTAEDESPSSVVPGSLKVNGVVRAKAFLQYSDLRLKANIADLVDAVNIVSQLKGRTYTWKSDSLEPSGGKRVIGLIAQEVRRVVPEVVHENEDGFLAVSYAELVPILIEALKEHIKKHETDKTEVKNQLAQLESKLDSIANVVEKEAMVQAQTQHQINMLHHNQQIHSQTIAQLPPTISVIPPHLKGLIFMEKSNVEEEFIKDTMYKRNFLRVGVVVTFILGLMTIMLGAILIGMTLSSPSQSITTTIVQARNLKQMDPDGAPDAYVEVSIGAQVYRTKTIWNDNQPSFEETFSAPLEGGTTEIIYQLYDDNVNPYFPPRRMGFATLSLAGLGDDKTYTDWLPLVPNLEGDQVSGDVQASIYISKPKQPGFELVLLFAGVFLTSVSLGLAFYVWKTSKQLQQQKQSVQMSNFKP